MTNVLPLLASLSDEQLLARVTSLAEQERGATAALIAALAEVDERRLYLREGFSSLFTYCTQALRFSEDAAYNRIRSARAAAKWPVILEMIADGSLTVTAVRLLSDVLTNANHEELLRSASCKSKREVEELIARLRPQPAITPSIRKVPTREATIASPSVASGSLWAPAAVTPSESQQAEASTRAPSNVKRSNLTPLSAADYRIQFTIPKATHDNLRRVQDLMRHTNPTGDPAVIFDRALKLLLEQLEKAKLGTATRPRKQPRPTARGSRHIPCAVKREVWARDSGRCAFMGTAGRCTEAGFLQYHHVLPHADGGEATAANIQLRCRAHNAYEAEEWFGAAIARERNELCANWSRSG